jgi:DNA-binding winged helix-turn-helix (wHTH) protein
MLTSAVSGSSFNATAGERPREQRECPGAKNRPGSMENQQMDHVERAETVRFGRFRLDSHRRELLTDGVPVPIGGRAFDVLITLVEAGGRLVTKDELLRRVWRGTFVGENCLRFQISVLRKTLGPDRHLIKTIAGQGYRFIADVTMHTEPDVVLFTRAGEPSALTNFPTAMSDLIGLEANSVDLKDLVAALRLIARKIATRFALEGDT